MKSILFLSFLTAQAFGHGLLSESIEALHEKAGGNASNEAVLALVKDYEKGCDEIVSDEPNEKINCYVDVQDFWYVSGGSYISYNPYVEMNDVTLKILSDKFSAWDDLTNYIHHAISIEIGEMIELEQAKGTDEARYYYWKKKRSNPYYNYRRYSAWKQHRYTNDVLSIFQKYKKLAKTPLDLLDLVPDYSTVYLYPQNGTAENRARTYHEAKLSYIAAVQYWCGTDIKDSSREAVVEERRKQAPFNMSTIFRSSFKGLTAYASRELPLYRKTPLPNYDCN